jgi:hypothetical protein
VFIPYFSARRREMDNNFTPIDLPVYIHILASNLLASDNVQSFSFPCCSTLGAFFFFLIQLKIVKNQMLTLKEIVEKVAVPVPCLTRTIGDPL